MKRRAFLRLAAGVTGLPLLRAAGANEGEESVREARTPSAAKTPPLVTGAERLVREDFAPLAGKRIGLITNQTGMVDGEHLIDRLHRSGRVRLAAIFAPEHGVRGEVEAGARVASGIDVKTGVSIHSLYGRTRKPTRAMLRGLDVLVFDVQDIGTRFYTYISTLGLAMQAAAEAGITFAVLDRPNPLGGAYVAGFVTEPEQISFVAPYPIPIAHGMTPGELARMIAGEGLLRGLGGLDLRVIGMEGWRRAQRWPDLGRAWLPTSPNIDTADAALLYAGAGLLEATGVSEGRGTSAPFRLVGADWIDAAQLARRLRAAGLSGVGFETARFTPRAIPGKASRPRYEGTTVAGVRLAVTDHSEVQPVHLGVALLCALQEQALQRGIRLVTRPAWLARLAGTRRLQAALSRGERSAAIVGAWSDDVAAYNGRRARYLMYT
jgi:uncharacterized protein YbbC (DUF1343 family)